MIPIRDLNPSKIFPIVTYIIILVNIMVYLFQNSMGNELEVFNYYYGLVPAKFTNPEIAHYFPPPLKFISLFSYMFLHGGFLHLLGNMWSLFIFGDNVEDHLGSLRYIFFYTLCGLASGFSHFILNPDSNISTIGGSGAIAGIMGAYFILYPRAKILTLIPIIIIPVFINIPAYIFLGVWFLLQFFNATILNTGFSGIAWWAHVGGFIFGIIGLRLFTIIPKSGTNNKLRKIITKKTTPRLQVIDTTGSPQDLNLYGTFEISTYEAFTGATKLVNIPWGYHKRLFNVKIPPGIINGQKLKLNGFGKTNQSGQKGDIILEIKISQLNLNI